MPQSGGRPDTSTYDSAEGASIDASHWGNASGECVLPLAPATIVLHAVRRRASRLGGARGGGAAAGCLDGEEGVRGVLCPRHQGRRAAAFGGGRRRKSGGAWWGPSPGHAACQLRLRPRACTTRWRRIVSVRTRSASGACCCRSVRAAAAMPVMTGSQLDTPGWVAYQAHVRE